MFASRRTRRTNSGPFGASRTALVATAMTGGSPIISSCRANRRIARYPRSIAAGARE